MRMCWQSKLPNVTMMHDNQPELHYRISACFSVREGVMTPRNTRRNPNAGRWWAAPRPWLWLGHPTNAWLWGRLHVVPPCRPGATKGPTGLVLQRRSIRAVARAHAPLIQVSNGPAGPGRFRFFLQGAVLLVSPCARGLIFCGWWG